MASCSDRQPLTLQKQCLQYIILHLEQLPTSSLALLPLSVRKELIWSLPIADVCQLEKTEFINGIEMEEYWNDKPQVNQNDVYNNMDSDFKWPFSSMIQPLSLPTKDWCYGIVVHCILMSSSILPGVPKAPILLTDVSNDVLCKLQNSNGDDIITYLYSTRKITNDNSISDPSTCDVIFPPRYSMHDPKIAQLPPNVNAIRSIESLQILVNAAIHSFTGELPKVLQIGFQPQPDNIIVCNMIQLLGHAGMDSILVLVDELRYLAVGGDQMSGLTSMEIEFVENVVRRAANLDVLIIKDSMEYPFESNREGTIFLDNLFTELCVSPSFLSKFHSLVLISQKFVVSHHVLDKFMRKFLSTPCDHPQTVMLAYITVTGFMCSYFASGTCPPTSPFWTDLKPEDSNYLHLKSIEFVHPCFTVQVPLTEFVANWSGQDVHHVMSTQTGDIMSSFVINFPRGHKRTHSDMDNYNLDL